VEEKPITLLLNELANGDKQALSQVAPLMYAELRKIADGHLRHERRGHTLQPTALVHELYVRLLEQQQPDFNNRSHFLRVAAYVMRQILIDHARARQAAKRGGAQSMVSLDEARDAGAAPAEEIIALDDALRELERRDPRKAQLVELRFFGGLTAEESAEVTELPVNQIRRELRLAQAWLQSELDNRNPSPM
jgi:RNA polymerase sigma factor (TIGR02999 family)